MLSWRSYVVPIFFACLLHLALVVLLLGDWPSLSKKQTFIEPNKVIKASLVTLKKTKPKVVRIKPKAKVKPKLKPKPKPVEQKNTANQKSVVDKIQKKETAKPLEQVDKNSLLDALLADEDDVMLEEDQRQQQQNDTVLVSQYGAAMRAEITNNWSRPPSARNEMVVVLEIQLVPTGDVVNVSVVESSGNLALDRSALLAVEKVGRFAFLQGMPSRLFEAEFRRTILRFKPSDLRL